MLAAVILICAILVGCNAFYTTGDTQENIKSTEFNKKIKKM